MAANGAWKEATAIYKMQTSQAQKPTSAQQNYEYGLKNPGFVTRQNELGKLGGTNITNTMGGQTNEFRKQVDKNDATFFGDVVKGGLKGQSNLNTINRLDSLLSSVETGAGAKIKQMAGSMGIAVQGVSDIQAAEALIAKLVPEQREPGSGAMSDGDLAMFLKSLPQIINQPEGNRLIIDTIRGLAEFEVEKGKIASKVFDSTNDYNRTDGRRDLLALKATFRERLTPQVNQIRNATPQQDDGLDAELKKRGL
ncbi:MAG: hypothetical protein GY761_03220 [Hyphomicrobiales bacterium]|nr:hypothetical protein [Hyphomicrobiales bacterium]